MPRFATLCGIVCSFAVVLVTMDCGAEQPTPRRQRPLTIPEMAIAYRVQAYLKHHHDRETYQRHRKAAEEMLVRWKAAGSPDTVEVIAWFQSARESALSGQTPPHLLELTPQQKEQLVDSTPQPEKKGTPNRTRPASMTKPAVTAEAETETEATLPSPTEIVPPEAYEESDKSDDSAETESGSPVNESETNAIPDRPSARKGAKSELGIVFATVKAFLRAVMP